MYRVKQPSEETLNSFYETYAPPIQTLMKDLAAGRISIPLKLGTTQSVQLTLQVQQGSPTWLFLDKYSKDSNLRVLLCGKWQDHLKIINYIDKSLSGQSWQKRMLKTEYDAGGYTIYGQDNDGNNIVEDFNEIMHWLFVSQIYEGGDSQAKFDKTAFVKERELLVCPYCGRQWIDIAEDGNRVSKPNIDHFLPKSKYPFLAMSFLI